MSGARNVEVLRGVLAEVEPMDDSSWDAWERRQVLSAAISTLEALERQGVIVATGEPSETCPLCHQPQARHPGGVYCPIPSEDSKAERIRALEAFARKVAIGSATRIVGDLKDEAARLLHPHKSWCRAEHEGVCISDPSEDSP
jgi:cytochrome c553